MTLQSESRLSAKMQSNKCNYPPPRPEVIVRVLPAVIGEASTTRFRFSHALTRPALDVDRDPRRLNCPTKASKEGEPEIITANDVIRLFNLSSPLGQ